MTTRIKRTLTLHPSAAEALAAQRNASGYVSLLVEETEQDWRRALAALREAAVPPGLVRERIRYLRAHVEPMTEDEAMAVLAREFWRGNTATAVALDAYEDPER